jgi:hypothetical protein
MTLATESFSGGREKGQWERREWAAESIEWFIEDQDFSPLYDLAPPSLVSLLDRRYRGRLIKRTTCGGGGKLYDGEKVCSSINHSILSGIGEGMADRGWKKDNEERGEEMRTKMIMGSRQ